MATDSCGVTGSEKRRVTIPGAVPSRAPRVCSTLISPIVVLMTRKAIETNLENGKQALEGK